MRDPTLRAYGPGRGPEALQAIMSYHLPYLSDSTSLTSLLRHQYKASFLTLMLELEKL